MEDIHNKIKKYGAVIYGLGRIGQNVYSMMRDWGCNPLLAWDKNAQNICDSIEVENLSEPVYNYQNKQIPIIICINTKKVYESVFKELSDYGFVNVHWIREVDNDQLCKHSEKFFAQRCNMCVINRGGVASI